MIVWMMTKSAAQENVTVLIVSRPGPLRDGVQALVGAMPQVGTVREADGLSMTSEMDSDSHPDLVLLTCDEGKGTVGAIVEQVKTRWPRSRCVTLVGSVEQQQEAESAGVDAVALSGLPAHKLLEVITGAL
jgi:DNA-binding NarL/FixJ family response regulator